MIVTIGPRFTIDRPSLPFPVECLEVDEEPQIVLPRLCSTLGLRKSLTQQRLVKQDRPWSRAMVIHTGAGQADQRHLTVIPYEAVPTMLATISTRRPISSQGRLGQFFAAFGNGLLRSDFVRSVQSNPIELGRIAQVGPSPLPDEPVDPTLLTLAKQHRPGAFWRLQLTRIAQIQTRALVQTFPGQPWLVRREMVEAVRSALGPAPFGELRGTLPRRWGYPAAFMVPAKLLRWFVHLERLDRTNAIIAENVAAVVVQTVDAELETKPRWRRDRITAGNANGRALHAQPSTTLCPGCTQDAEF